MIKSAPFYWVGCNALGCENRCPEADDEAIAFLDEGQANEVADSSGWWSGPHESRVPEGRSAHYCPEHYRLGEKYE